MPAVLEMDVEEILLWLPEAEAYVKVSDPEFEA